MGKSLSSMQEEVYEVNVANGWFEGDDRSFGEDVALLHEEVSEAWQAYRQWGLDDATEPMKGDVLPKPEGVGSELADTFIRILDTCKRRGIDLEAEYERKIAYNRTRGYRHGGRRV